MGIKPDVLKKLIDALKNDLGEGLVASDIWATGEPKSLAGNKKWLTLFNGVTGKLNKALQGAEFPGIGNYYMINLPGNRLAVILLIDAYQHFILVDLSKTTMGILMSVALPNLINSWLEASEQQTRGRGASGLDDLLDALSIGFHTMRNPKRW